MLDCYLMTICGDKAGKTGIRTSAIYNWARRYNVQWNEIVTADKDDLLIAILNNIKLDEAKAMLASA